jgi:hypothetical protein
MVFKKFPVLRSFFQIDFFTNNPFKLYLNKIINQISIIEYVILHKSNARAIYNKNLTKIDWINDPNIKSTKTLFQESILISHITPALDFNIQQSPSIFLTGPFIQNETLKELKGEENLKILNFFNENNNKKLIYINMGSVWRPSEKNIERLMEGLIYAVEKNNDISIIYRVSGYNNISSLIDMIPKNLKKNFYLTTAFVPQKHILNNNSLKLIISHCGISSTLESLYHGIPILGTPLEVDQFINAELIELKGFGKKLYWEDMKDKYIIQENIQFILTDEKINKNIKKVSKFIQSQNSFEVFLKLVDMGLNNQLEYYLSMRRSDSDFNFIELFDNYFFYIINFVLLILFYKILKKCFCFRNRDKNKVKKD